MYNICTVCVRVHTDVLGGCNSYTWHPHVIGKVSSMIIIELSFGLPLPPRSGLHHNYSDYVCMRSIAWGTLYLPISV